MIENIIFLFYYTAGNNESKVVIATNDNNSSLSFKNLLLERWILLLNIFGLYAGNKIVRADSNAETQESPHTVLSPVAVYESAAHANASAYTAAVGMVDTACKERGPLTADEGASLRTFFQSEGGAQSLRTFFQSEGHSH